MPSPPSPDDSSRLTAVERAQKEHHVEHVRERGEIEAKVAEMNAAAIKHVEAIVAPFAPLALDVAQLKTDTAKQTPIIQRLDRRSRRSEVERKRRAILDEGARADKALWKKRWRSLGVALGILAALAEIYHGLHG